MLDSAPVNGWQSFLAERPIAVFATVGSDGIPHAVPVEVVVLDATPHVWIESDSVKARNARREGRAALIAYKGQQGVLVRGALRFIETTDPDYPTITKRFLDKYKRDENFGNDLVIAVAPDRVTSWE